MNIELTKTYRLRNGTLGLVEELLNDGTFYGTVTAPPTDLRVRVIWDKDGLSTKRGTAWDLVEEVAEPIEDDMGYHGYVHGGRNDELAHLESMRPGSLPPSDLSRIAAALERIADVFDKMSTEPVNDYGETFLPALKRAIDDGINGR